MTRRQASTTVIAAMAALLVAVTAGLYIDTPSPSTATPKAETAAWIEPAGNEAPVIDAVPETAG